MKKKTKKSKPAKKAKAKKPSLLKRMEAGVKKAGTAVKKGVEAAAENLGDAIGEAKFGEE